MKIVSWNACCRFRDKFKEILELGADIYVIQECEKPTEKHGKEYVDITRNGFWIGDLNYKGLMVFSPNPEIKLKKLDWNLNGLRYFIPVKVNDEFTLVGSWACNPYIEEFFKFIDEAKDQLTDKTVIIGDLNSNPVFDTKKGKNSKTHLMAVDELRKFGMEDIYHHKTGDGQGNESKGTFYMYRHEDKPYHIDHCFANPSLISSFRIMERDKWLKFSDHLPIEVVINLKYS